MRGERMLTLARAAGRGPRPSTSASATCRRSWAAPPLPATIPLSPPHPEALPGLNEAGVLPGPFFRSSPAPCSSAGHPPGAGARGDLVGPPTRRASARCWTCRSRRAAAPAPRAAGLRHRCRVSHLDGGRGDRAPGPARGGRRVRLASGRELTFPFRAGIETAEWAIDRSDVRASGPTPPPAGRFELSRAGPGLRRPPLPRRPRPGRPLPGRGPAAAARARHRRPPLPAPGRSGGRRAATGLSLVSAYLSDAAFLREIPAVPQRAPLRRARGLRAGPSGGSGPGRRRTGRGARGPPSRRWLRSAARGDPGRERGRSILPGRSHPRGPRAAGRGQAPRGPPHLAPGGRSGTPGPERTWDPGWTARVDGKEAPLVRVGEAQIGLPIGPGPHRIGLRHDPRGFQSGLFLFGLAGLGLTLPSPPRGAAAGRVDPFQNPMLASPVSPCPAGSAREPAGGSPPGSPATAGRSVAGRPPRSSSSVRRRLSVCRSALEGARVSLPSPRRLFPGSAVRLRRDVLLSPDRVVEVDGTTGPVVTLLMVLLSCARLGRVADFVAVGVQTRGKGVDPFV